MKDLKRSKGGGARWTFAGPDLTLQSILITFMLVLPVLAGLALGGSGEGDPDPYTGSRDCTGRIGKPDFAFSVTAADGVDTPSNYEYGSIQITVSEEEPTQGTTVTINATIFNTGTEEGQVDVYFHDGPPEDGDLIGTDTLSIKAFRYDIANSLWNTTDEPEYHTLWVLIDPQDSVDENNEENNNGTKDVVVNMIPSVNMERVGADFEDGALEDEEFELTSEVVDTQSDLDVGFEFNWSFRRAENGSPSPVSMTGKNLTGITQALNTSGTYNISLTVTDDGGASATLMTTMEIMNVVPDASFGYYRQTDLEDEKILLDASSSRDSSSDMKGLLYAWDFGDGTSTDLAPMATVEKVYHETGIYLVMLRVRDDDGAEDGMEREISVTNMVPKVDVGEDLEVLEDQEFSVKPMVNDTVSDLDDLEYRWDLDEDSGAPPAHPNVTHSYPTSGTRTLSLVVTDDDGASGSDDLEVKVNNVPPTVEMDHEIGGDGSRVTFTAMVNDTPSDLARGPDIAWDFGDGRSGRGTSITHTFTEVGTYTVTVTVTDDDAASTGASVTVTVDNQIPDVQMDGPHRLEEDEEGRFSATAVDMDGEVKDTLWDMGDGTRIEGTEALHTYTRSGSFTVTFSAIDDRGARAEKTLTVEVVNPVPLARADWHRMGEVGEPMIFDGTPSQDNPSDMEDLIFRWVYGDGFEAQGSVVEHIYEEEGNYTVVLTVTDDDGALDRLEMAVTIVRDLWSDGMDRLLQISVWTEPKRVGPGDLVSVRGVVNLDLPGGMEGGLGQGDILVTVESVSPGWSITALATVGRDGDFEAILEAPSDPGTYRISATITVTPVQASEETTIVVQEEGEAFAPGTVTVATAVVTVGAVGGGIAVAGTDLGRYKFFTLMIPLFTRLKRSKVLDNFERGRIFEYVTKNPGSHYSEIKINLDLNNGSLAYHLKVLERMEFIKSRRFGMYKRFFPFKFRIRRKRYRPIQEQILEVIEKEPGLGQGEISKTLGVARSTVNYHCNLLVKGGTIRSSRKGKKKRYWPD